MSCSWGLLMIILISPFRSSSRPKANFIIRGKFDTKNKPVVVASEFEVLKCLCFFGSLCKQVIVTVLQARLLFIVRYMEYKKRFVAFTREFEK